MSDTIQLFLDERKAGWLKGRIAAGMPDAERENVEAEAAEKFAPENWLPDAAKRAGQLNLSTHPGKFSHPNAKTSMILAESSPQPDGFLRSGNVQVEPDILGNAAALDVYKFLSLTLEDGQTILKHLQQNTPAIQDALTIKSMPYAELAKGLLAIQKSDAEPITDPRVKQVYFPLNTAPAGETEYHLLSILTPSGMVFELKDRIQAMRFSDETKAAREARKAGEAHPTGFQDILGLTMIGYGGTKPQNISVANSQNGGKAYLLPSFPPQFKKRNIRWPRQNFFKENLWFKAFQADFLALHRIFADQRHNLEIRNERDQIFLNILDRVVDISWSLRAEGVGWSEGEYYAQLPQYQRIWLDDIHQDTRRKTQAWMDQVVDALMRWLLQGYESAVKRQGETVFLLTDEEIRELKHLTLIKHQEALR